jgi:D-alanyl-D-alanine carboxypeptidase
MLRRRGLALVPLILIAPAAARADEVDDYVAAQMAKRHIPGLSLAVVKDGLVVKAKGYGLANVELKAPATEETVYELGSITKQFTAAAVMMLVEEGKLGLDDPIHDHLKGLPDAWKGVAVRHLLNHTSGIKSYTGVTDFVKLTRNDYKAEEIVKLVADKPMEIEPGESWAYNNTGYYLLGMLVEKASGKRYGDFLAERIFKPLGMTRTRPNNPKEVIPGRAAGYGEIFGVLINRDPITPTSAFAAGNLVSTVGDMVKWDAALAGGKLLSASSYDQMYTPTRLKNGDPRPYGFGWAVGSRFRHKYLNHGGGTAGFSTIIYRYPADKLTVIVLSNLASADTPGIAEGIARIYLPELSVRTAEAATDPDPKVTERLRGLFADVLAGKLDEESLATGFHKHLASAKGKADIRSLAKAGDLKAFDFLARDGEGKEATVYYKVTLGESLYLVTVHLDGAGKVTGMLAQKED